MRTTILIVFLLFGCDGASPDDPPPAPLTDCPLTAADQRDGIGLYECAPGVYVCHAEFVTPPGGCVVLRGNTLEGMCVAPDPTRPAGCP